jgi:phosphopantetheine adenylyltransferase
MMKSVIAVIGGSFDPPTLAHAMIGAEILNRRLADRLLYVPCGARSDKYLQSGAVRVRMVEAMMKGCYIYIHKYIYRLLPRGLSRFSQFSRSRWGCVNPNVLPPPVT